MGDGKMDKFPVWLTINHTCNLRCGWCYQREVAKGTKMMDYQLTEKLIDLCSGLPVKKVTLIGGEPTLHPRFLDIARYVENKGLVTSVISNSVRFADVGFLEESREAGVKAITTSVKGSSGEEYLTTAGCDVFDLVRRAIFNIERSGIAHHVSVTISNSVISNWNRMVGFIKDCGAKNFYFSFEKPAVLSSGVTFDDRVMPRNIAGFVQDVMYPSLIETGVSFKMELMLPQCVFRDGFVEKNEDECHAFGTCLLINCDGVVFDPEGAVLPCNHLIAYALGKYGNDFVTPADFLRWKQSGEASRFYRTARLAPGERCAKCVKWSKCGAGCRLYWLYRGPNELLNVSP